MSASAASSRRSPAHGAIDPCRRESPEAADGVRGGLQSLGCRGADELGRQERVPARRRADRGGKGRRHRRAHAGRDQAGDRRLAQRRELEDGLPVGQFGQRRVRRCGVWRPRGELDRERQVRDPPREVDGAAQGRRVGPLRVVDRDQERPTGGEARDEPIEAMEDRRLARDPVIRRRERERGERQPCGALQQLLGIALAVQHRVEQLADHSVGKLLLELAADRGQNREAATSRARRQLLQHARLADPGAALHDDDAAAAGEHGVEQARKLRELGLALEQDRHAPTVDLRGREAKSRGGPTMWRGAPAQTLAP